MISQKVHKHSWWWIEVESCENEQQVDGEEDLHSLPCFQILFRCVCVCYCAHVSVCECVHRSLFSSIAKNLFPAKSKVGGGCISTSLHYRERWGGGGGGGWRRHICYKTGRNWKTLTHTHTHTHTHTPALSDTWRNHSVSTNLFSPRNVSHIFKHITSGTSSVLTTDTHITLHADGWVSRI